MTRRAIRRCVLLSVAPKSCGCGTPHPQWPDAGGFRVGALTNNWAHTGDDDNPLRHDGTRALKEHFDVFIESSVEGLRKPDPKIYELACERMGKQPGEMIFLDDIGPNLKPPRAMGMATIKVETPEQALRELGALVGMDFVSA